MDSYSREHPRLPNLCDAIITDNCCYGDGSPYDTSLIGKDPLPLSTSDSNFTEKWNSRPEFIRLTVNNIPSSESLLESCKLPLTAIIQPIPSNVDVPCVSFGKSGPPRCLRCRAYVNPFFRFSRGGSSFICNICNSLNTVPDYYFCNLDASGQRLDLQNRPELNLGTVDFDATSEYLLTRPAVCPRVIILIDCSQSSLSTGVFDSALRTIEFIANASAQGHELGYEIGIMLFDKNLHILDLTTQDSGLLTVADLGDPFLPIPNLFVDPREPRLIDLLRSLRCNFLASNSVSSSFWGSALVAISAFKNLNVGGRIVCFISNSTSIRDDSNKQTNMKTTETVSGASAAGISFIAALSPATMREDAEIHTLCSKTEGRVFCFEDFNSTSNLVCTTLVRYLYRPFLFDAMAKVRVGSALQCSEMVGAANNSMDLYFPTIDYLKTIAFNFIYDSKIPDNEEVSIQCAILHTSSSGKRRIRVINITVPVSSSPAVLFKHADPEALFFVLIQKALANFKGTREATDFVNLMVSRILAAYRRLCLTDARQSQLILPASLKFLPLLCLCFSNHLKQLGSTLLLSSVIANSVDTGLDLRKNDELAHLLNVPVRSLINMVYPQLIKVEMNFREPTITRCHLSIGALSPHGIYIFNSLKKIVVVLESQTLEANFVSIVGTVCDIAEASVFLDYLPALDNTLSNTVRSIVDALQNENFKQKPIELTSADFFRSSAQLCAFLLEDDSRAESAYFEFICRLHNQINHELAIEKDTERGLLNNILH